MKIDLRKVTVGELVQDYNDNGEGGVVGYSGKLDIRPPYQREFIYGGKQRDAVIETINNGFPLNVMYWAVRDDGTYEVIDGQQRTISIAQYVQGDFSLNERSIHNLTHDERDHILGYELMVYVCSGTDSEKLKWFETINIAGERLTKQELRNAVYAGSWVSNAKGYFSRRNCPAYKIGQDYLTGSPIRQDYLETAIKWINGNEIEAYMSKHQHDPTAIELWNHFQSVIGWIQAIFSVKRTKYMTTVDWGSLYNAYKDAVLDPADIEAETAKLILDDDVTKKAGIYPYILTRDEKHLSIRAFTDAMRQKAYEKQSGECRACGNEFDISAMEADHIDPWIEGGKTTEDNCQMLCRPCNRRKSSK